MYRDPMQLMIYKVVAQGVVLLLVVLILALPVVVIPH